ncbi:GNAT family N-acetyltransferase [Streptococcus caprae]|uniref:GNAT family N-acetyltransferase n=1 Tax=Streptococcus caprae TaxID=1640501 RepID=A0ABV8CWZ6_9STRE
MNILVTNRLSSEQIQSVKTLVSVCQAYDGTARDPYLSSNLNFDPDMPAFFLVNEEETLVGFLAVYADDDEAELAVFVHPAYRRQGLAKQLYVAFQEQTASYPIASVTFWTERAFLDKHPDLPGNFGLIENPDTDTWLVRNREPYVLDKREDVVFKLADEAMLSAIATFQSQAFESDYDVALRYATEALADEEHLLYCLSLNDDVIASCTVNISSDYNYLYGLAVLPLHQGKGYGSYLVKCVVNDLLGRNNWPFQIAVEDDNSGAKRLYEKIGFVYQTQIIYLDVPEEDGP